MKLSEQRAIFTFNVAFRLVPYAIALGYHPVFDDVKARDGHMKNSLHYSGLAVDLILYNSDFEYMTQLEDYRELGEYWEKVHPNCRWGGRFKSGDGNHFSMSWDDRQ